MRCNIIRLCTFQLSSTAKNILQYELFKKENIYTLQGWVSSKPCAAALIHFRDIRITIKTSQSDRITNRISSIQARVPYVPNPTHLTSTVFQIIDCYHSVWKRLTAANRFETRVPRKRILHKIFLIANKTCDCGLNTCVHRNTTHSYYNTRGVRRGVIERFFVGMD